MYRKPQAHICKTNKQTLVIMKKFPLFTVIIPTKDRSEYLHHTLRTCIEQSYPNLEIIVSDDASVDDTVKVVNEFSKIDNRIRLITRENRVGMKENFEIALSNARNGYVIALGGDDGLIPDGIMSMYNIILKTGTQLLTWCPSVYHYPTELNREGQFSIYRHKGLKKINSHQFLERQTNHFNYVSDIECPMFYVKGVVSTKLINRVKSRTKDGKFYSCPTPDGYSGIVLAGEVESFYFSSEPFSIYGVSPSSQGQVYLSSDDISKAKSEEFFQFTKTTPMHKELASQPYSPLLSLMTVDFLLTAKDLTNWPGRFPPINYKKMLKASIGELSSCRYSVNRIEREIAILYEIAKFHGLEQYLNQLISQTKRYGSDNINISNAISPKMIYLNPFELGINNIYEAAFATKYLYKSITKFNLQNLLRFIIHSFNIYITKRKKVGSFPKINN